MSNDDLFQGDLHKQYVLVGITPTDIQEHAKDYDLEFSNNDLHEICKSLSESYQPNWDLNTAIEEEIDNYVEVNKFILRRKSK